MSPEIANLRLEYSRQSLLEKDVAANPIDQFSRWWQQATQSAIVEPNAMTLATASADGVPAARIVLLKNFDTEGFVFFTNYNSYKGMQLSDNPRACLVFFWKELERQVRITGLVSTLSDSDNDAYFFSRPVGSQLGAITSPQSQVIESREWLDAQYETNAKELGVAQIRRPAHRYSWWSQRFPSVREQNKGWRIDYISVTEPLKGHIKDADIFPDVKHSDHCPVFAEIDIDGLD